MDAFLTEGPVADCLPEQLPADGRAEGRVRRGARAWFVFYVFWLAGWAGLSLLLLGRDQAGDGRALSGWLLCLMCFYLSLCNSFIPLPTAWIVLLAASPDFVLLRLAWLHAGLVSGLAALATVVANLTEYHLMVYLLGWGLGRRARRAAAYTWAVRHFDRAPFQLLTLVAFVPIPVDAVRWLAILRGYCRVRFGLAYLLGRGVRYLFLTAGCLWLGLQAREIVLVQLGIIALAVAARLVWRLRPARAARPSPALFRSVG